MRRCGLRRAQRWYCTTGVKVVPLRQDHPLASLLPAALPTLVFVNGPTSLNTTHSHSDSFFNVNADTYSQYHEELARKQGEYIFWTH
jgi:hypothetical protein